MSPRKIFAALALLVGCVTASVTAATPALAAQAHGAAKPAACFYLHYDDFTDNAGVTQCDNWNITEIDGTSDTIFAGHMEFYGPNGFIGNSSDQMWYPGYKWTIPINQTGFPGSKWCVILWQIEVVGYHELDNNCVTI